MTVAELMKELETCDPHADVRFHNRWREGGEIGKVTQFEGHERRSDGSRYVVREVVLSGK